MLKMVYEPHIFDTESESGSGTDNIETKETEETEETEQTEQTEQTEETEETEETAETEQTANVNCCLFYNEAQEIQNEIDAYNYYIKKDTGDWLFAKDIVSYSKDKLNSEFFFDYLDLLFKDNNDNFDNIIKVIYSSDNKVFEFNTTISKYIVDNLKICKFKPNGYLFNKNGNNVWDFTIVVITSTNIYSANRYIDETKIGCF